MRVWGRRARAGFGAAALAAMGIGAGGLLAPAPASAGGGDWLYPVRDRYDPGQQATLVGYTVPYAYRWGAENEIDHDWRGRGPFYAYLRVIDPATAIREASEGTNPFVHPTDVRVGQVVVEERADSSRGDALRASVTVGLPSDLAAGAHQVVVCNDPCTIGLGELLESTVYVGVDPPEPIVRDWPLDEPLIGYLDGHALLADPVCQGNCDDIDDWTVTAAEVRAGYQPIPTSAPPVRQPAATVATTGPPTSGPVVDAGKSPAGRAGVDPAGGISSEVVAWLMGFGVLLVVWCLAWRWRPQDARMVVRQANGQHGPPTSDDDPRPVHIKL